VALAQVGHGGTQPGTARLPTTSVMNSTRAVRRSLQERCLAVQVCFMVWPGHG